MSSRSEFKSAFGFVMTAMGAAVGLANVWSFPAMTANNGGATFVIIYLLMSFLIAYPALIAEMTLGRYTKKGIIGSLTTISNNRVSKLIGQLSGCFIVFVATIGLTFYAIVTGAVLAESVEPIFAIFNDSLFYNWFTSASFSRDALVSTIVLLIACIVVMSGVNDGIEKWSKRLMPMLVIAILVLIGIIAFMPDASEGFKLFLKPDFSSISPGLFFDAMGHAFFSMAIGTGVMVVYGSYLDHSANIPKVGLIVLLLDTFVACIAGLLVIPAMFVARNAGVNIFDDSGQLVQSTMLLFQVMPALFNDLGFVGIIFKILFFGLLFIAAITSMFSGLEVSVSIMEEKNIASRKKGALLVTFCLLFCTLIMIFKGDALVTWITNFTIKSFPISSVLTCFFVGWVLSRNKKLQELNKGYPDIESSLFWKIWPWYVKFVCPLLPIILFVQVL